MFVQGCSCTLLQKTHWMYTHRILPAKWQCSINLVPHVQRVRYRSLHCHPFRIPILKRAWPAYIHAYIEYVHIYQQPQRRKRGRVWAMHALHPVLTTLMMFRTAEDDVCQACVCVCVLVLGGWQENCATRFLRMHTGSDYGNSLQFKAGRVTAWISQHLPCTL